ncbi:MAG TPA: methionyl-tRNA formyltransferase [Longimicrobiales bacterium]|nr:methionyl-tRNA formyltransferase [Longimicrobiales bacterium]
MRILFWGTPDYAVPSLRALLGEGHDVVAVVTQPDRPAGRGREVRQPPVKTVALSELLDVFQPERAKDPAFISKVRALQPDISVVIAYGQILPKEVLDLPKFGSINAHASLLPALRGAAPINWAIVRGYETTGVTIMRMAEKMDAGPIIYQAEEPIDPDEAASDLWTRLSETSAESLIEALALIETGTFEETPQDESRVTFAPRISRADARIDFTKPAADVANLIRGMDEIPGAWTTHSDVEYKLYRPQVLEDETSEQPGTIIEISSSDPTRGMVVGCGGGAVAIREIKPQGKRRMTVADWSHGSGLAVGSVFRAV